MDNELKTKLSEIWADDKLGRAADAEIIHRFIAGQLKLRENAGLDQTFVLNLDSDWGSGKSYLLTRFPKDLTACGHLAVLCECMGRRSLRRSISNSCHRNY